MKALILAAGYATRLYPLTKEYPKSLLAIRKRPMINYIVDKLEEICAIDEIIVVTNSKFFSIFQKWAKGLKVKKRLSLVDDLTKDHAGRRGAIGDMDFAIRKKRIKDDLLVIGGDNLFDGGLEGFLFFAKIHTPHPVIGVYNIKSKIKASKYGVVKLDKRNKIINFSEKPQHPESTLVAMCLYYFPKEKIKRIKEYLGAKSNQHDATGFYIDWLRRRESVYGFIFEGLWYDIGHLKFYKEANKSYGKA